MDREKDKRKSPLMKKVTYEFLADVLAVMNTKDMITGEGLDYFVQRLGFQNPTFDELKFQNEFITRRRMYQVPE